MKPSMPPVGATDKPATRKPNARLRWHKANHREAWAGLVKMPPEEVGVYWRIILLQYINKAAHAFAEDAEMAQACHSTLKDFRRLRNKLIARGRLEVDEENGIYFDKRAMEEMVEAGFLSEEQIERANKRWAKTPAEPPAKPRVVVDNVRALDEDALGKLAEVGLNYPLKSAPSTPPSQFPIEEEQQLSALKAHASRVQNLDINLQAARSVPARAASPPLQGGGPRSEPHGIGQLSAAERATFLAEQRKRLELDEPANDVSAQHERIVEAFTLDDPKKGFDGTGADIDVEPQAVDHIARRK